MAGRPLDEIPHAARGGGSSRLFVIGKYALFQLPELAVVAVGVYLARDWVGMSDRVALAILAVWVLKDAAMFPFVRKAYEPHSRGGARALLDGLGTAAEDLDPRGFVRIGSELWRAELIAGAELVKEGAPVRVRAVEGLTLRVEGDPEVARRTPDVGPP